MSLTKTIVNRPTTILIVFILVISLGLYASLDLAIDLYPEITIPTLIVICNNSGVGPEQIEKTITRPLESSLGSVSNIDKITSTSAKGGSTLILSFTYGTDMNEVTNEVRDKIDFVKPFLPDSADSPLIFKFDTSMIPIMYLALRGNRSAEELSAIAEDFVAPRLEQIEGVATAGTDGGRKRMIRVEISQNRLSAYDLSLTQISGMIRGQNVQISAGSITEGNKNFLIQTSGEYKSIEEIKNTVIAYKGNAKIKLRDIANVIDGYEDESSLVYLNGDPGITLTIQKQSSVNSVQTAEKIQERLETLKSELPKGVYLEVIYDQTTMIKNSISQVTSTAILGGILAILILLLFLRSIRSVLIIAFSIPISIITTLLFMYFYGLTLNILTLAGLALGIGMLVDNSIVILENIYRYREKGAKLKPSAVLGTQEMITAIISSTLTTICVFLPLAIFKDQLEIIGEMVSALAFTVVFSLSSSIVVGIFLVPVLSSHYLPLLSKEERKLWKPLQIADNYLENLLNTLDNYYKNALRFVLSHKLITILLIMGIFIGSLFLIPSVGLNFLPSEEGDVIQIDMELPVGTKLEVTKDVVNQFRLLAEREIKGYESIVTWSGMKSFMGFMGASETHKGRVLITLPEFKERIDQESEVKEKLRANFDSFPSVKFKFSSGGGPQGGGSPIDILVRSNDLYLARDTALAIKNVIIDNVPDATEPDIDMNEGLPQIEVMIDRDKAYSYGLNIATIASEIQANINGTVSSTYNEDGNQFDILLILDKKDRSKIPDLEKIFVSTPTGNRIPIANLASIVKTTGPVGINRENQMRIVHVEAGLKKGAKLNEVVSQINKLIESEIPKSDDVIISWGGDAKDMQEIGVKFIIILLISIFLVFGVMASQFESFLDPFIIFFTIPLMLIGVVGIYVITGEQFSMYTAVGLVVLAGIVVNNGIVLVDYTNLLHSRGLSITEACVEAGGNRLRPILMTTLTTILGMTPMAFLPGEGSTLSQPIAKTVVGGLTVSTIFTLFLIPVIYSIFNTFSEKRKFTKAEKRQAILEKRRLEFLENNSLQEE